MGRDPDDDIKDYQNGDKDIQAQHDRDGKESYSQWAEDQWSDSAGNQ